LRAWQPASPSDRRRRHRAGIRLLIGGEPASVNQPCCCSWRAFAKAGRRAVYFTGERPPRVRLRADRLRLAKVPLALASGAVCNILATLADGPRADLVVIDSIQTLWADALEPHRHVKPGARSRAIVRYAKAQGGAAAGRPRLGGQIAGPR
jgi:DNA repair protein RadA/Sms